MKVTQLIEHLQTLPPDAFFVAQFEFEGRWYNVPFDTSNVFKVPGDNNMVGIQLAVPGWAK
jgi:hypothetical protein